MRHFRENWVGKYGLDNWHAGSLDLTPPDFFVWRYVKDRVVKTPVNNLSLLKGRIMRAIKSRTLEMIDRVRKNLENCLYTIIRENGGHIEHL